MEQAQGLGVGGHRHAVGAAAEAWRAQREDEEKGTHLLQWGAAEDQGGAQRHRHRDVRADSAAHHLQASRGARVRDRPARAA
eukprot:3023916-Prymnesium_polylepis.1